MRLNISSMFLLIVASAGSLAAQQPPVRPLGPVTHVSAAGLLASVSAVRRLSDGAVIVNDIAGRQLLLLDADLNVKSVIADSTPRTSGSYTGRAAGLIAFGGDSSLFIDPQSLSMLVINGRGEVTRVMAIPRATDAWNMIGGPNGTPGIDAQGRIVYRGAQRPVLTERTETGQRISVQKYPDSAPIVRVSLTTRVLDTIAMVKILPYSSSTVQSNDGSVHITYQGSLLPVVDDWALLPDGRLAVVRGNEYHVDWRDTSGVWASTPRVPYRWERLSDDGKQKLVDSARVEAETQREKYNEAVSGGKNAFEAMSVFAGTVNGGMTFTARTPRAQGRGPAFIASAISMVNAKELPDYRPAFHAGAVRVDEDGNIWIRTTAPSNAGAIYDVISSMGQLVDRVKIPFGRVISGFGPGVVYMGVLDERGARVECARIR